MRPHPPAAAAPNKALVQAILLGRGLALNLTRDIAALLAPTAGLQPLAAAAPTLLRAGAGPAEPGGEGAQASCGQRLDGQATRRMAPHGRGDAIHQRIVQGVAPSNPRSIRSDRISR